MTNWMLINCTKIFKCNIIVGINLPLQKVGNITRLFQVLSKKLGPRCYAYTRKSLELTISSKFSKKVVNIAIVFSGFVYDERHLFHRCSNLFIFFLKDWRGNNYKIWKLQIQFKMQMKLLWRPTNSWTYIRYW